MRTFVKLSAIASTLVILLLSVSPAGSWAQPDVIEGCGTQGPRIQGDHTGIAQSGKLLTVNVPSTGTYFSIPASGYPIALLICHVESGSSIVIDANTGKEVTRTVGDPAGKAILDQIAASARIEPVALAPPPNLGEPQMTPPQTGDAGLKSIPALP